MTQQAELLNKIDKIPQKYFREVIDFLGYLEHKAQQEEMINASEQKTSESTVSLQVDSNGKFLLTKEKIEEMERKSPTLHKLAGILHTDMTLEEIRMARLTKHL